MRETPTIVKMGSLGSFMRAAGRKGSNNIFSAVKPRYLSHASRSTFAGAGIGGAGMASKEMLDDKEGIDIDKIIKATGLGGAIGLGVGTSRYFMIKARLKALQKQMAQRAYF